MEDQALSRTLQVLLGDDPPPSLLFGAPAISIKQVEAALHRPPSSLDPKRLLRLAHKLPIANDRSPELKQLTRAGKAESWIVFRAKSQEVQWGDSIGMMKPKRLELLPLPSPLDPSPGDGLGDDDSKARTPMTGTKKSPLFKLLGNPAPATAPSPRTPKPTPAPASATTPAKDKEGPIEGPTRSKASRFLPGMFKRKDKDKDQEQRKAKATTKEEGNEKEKAQAAPEEVMQINLPPAHALGKDGPEVFLPQAKIVTPATTPVLKLTPSSIPLPIPPQPPSTQKKNADPTTPQVSKEQHQHLPAPHVTHPEATRPQVRLAPPPARTPSGRAEPSNTTNHLKIGPPRPVQQLPSPRQRQGLIITLDSPSSGSDRGAVDSDDEGPFGLEDCVEPVVEGKWETRSKEAEKEMGWEGHGRRTSADGTMMKRGKGEGEQGGTVLPLTEKESEGHEKQEDSPLQASAPSHPSQIQIDSPSKGLDATRTNSTRPSGSSGAASPHIEPRFNSSEPREKRTAKRERRLRTRGGSREVSSADTKRRADKKSHESPTRRPTRSDVSSRPGNVKVGDLPYTINIPDIEMIRNRLMDWRFLVQLLVAGLAVHALHVVSA